jgi:hypothetical protein
VPEYADGDGLDPFWRGFFSLACLDMVLDPEVDVAMEVFSDILGPHPGKRLADST